MSRLAAIHLFEQHDEAYHVWAAAGVRARTLVHVDAHHDLAWLDADQDVNIANYVCQALKDQRVSDVIWVAPDPLLSSAASRAGLARQLNELRRDYHEPRRSRRATAERLEVELLGRRIRILALDQLPPSLGPVLLDLDTDFCIMPDETLPWIWPTQLVARLEERAVVADICTIAYSVEGGYTPLEWKHLGDALAHAMAADPEQATRAAGFARLRDAVQLRAAGAGAEAERALHDAAAALPDLAAPAYLRARLLAASGRTTDARAAYRSAIAIDRSYTTAYASAGFWHLDHQRPDQAERAFLDALELDPPDGWAALGLARIAERRRDWPAAESWAVQALARDSTLVDAHRLRGRLLERRGRRQEACAAYRQSLKLALHGHAPMAQPITSRRRSDQLVADVHHGRTYVRVARLEARDGRLEAATAAFRFGLAVDPIRPFTCVRFAVVCLRRRRWALAARQLLAACAAVPAALHRTTKRAWRRSRRSRRSVFLAPLAALRT